MIKKPILQFVVDMPVCALSAVDWTPYYIRTRVLLWNEKKQHHALPLGKC